MTIFDWEHEPLQEDMPYEEFVSQRSKSGPSPLTIHPPLMRVVLYVLDGTNIPLALRIVFFCTKKEFVYGAQIYGSSLP